MLTALTRPARMVIVFCTMMMLLHGSWASLHQLHRHSATKHSVHTAPQQLAAQSESQCHELQDGQHSAPHSMHLDASTQQQQPVDCQDCAVSHHCGQLSVFSLSPQLGLLAPQQYSLVSAAHLFYQFNSIDYSAQPLLRPPRD